MTLIQLRSVEKFYGGRAVLRGLEMKVNPGARLGLVGGNGAGKSTVLRILAGLEEVDGGEVTRRRGLSVAFLPQHVEGDGRTPLRGGPRGAPELAEVRGGRSRTARPGSRARVADDLRKMQRLLERHGRLLQRFTELGGQGFEGEARSYLRSLGLDGDDADRPTSDLSGGQRKLAALAACLCAAARRTVAGRAGVTPGCGAPGAAGGSDPDLRRGGRRRLPRPLPAGRDRHGDRRAGWREDEVVAGQLLGVRARARARAQAPAATLRYPAEGDSAPRRGDPALPAVGAQHRGQRHARQARVKQRQIERMDKIDRPVLERRRIGLGFRENVRGGKKVLELREASVAFGEEPVLIGVDLTVARGERVGVIGANGAGKSVLAKLLAGIIPPTEGERWVGPSIKTGYLAQDPEPPASATPSAWCGTRSRSTRARR